MVDIVDILDNMDNFLPFKNNVKYKLIKFMQVSKMTKMSIIMFFSNPTLTPIQEYLSYKNVDKMRVLLIKLPYNKIT